MAFYRIHTLDDVTLLLQESGLHAIDWGPGSTPTGFANWLFARKAPLVMDTSELAELIDEFELSNGDEDLDARDAADMGKGIDGLNRELVVIAEAIRQIRLGPLGEDIMTVLARMATSSNLAQEVFRLEGELLGCLMAALELLKQATHPLMMRRIGGYRPGRNQIEDTLAAHHILKLDEHLARQPPLDAKEYWGIEVIALGRLANDAQTTALLSHRLMQLRVAQVAGDSERRFDALRIRGRGVV